MQRKAFIFTFSAIFYSGPPLIYDSFDCADNLKKMLFRIVLSKELSFSINNRQRPKESEKSDLRFFRFHWIHKWVRYLPAMYRYAEEEQAAHCLECGEPIYGRADKKFCDCNCRNRWHSRLRSDQNPRLKTTLSILTRNYGILESIYDMHTASCPAEVLERMGFRQEYVTHSPIKKGKHLEYRCFDFVYNLSQTKLFNLRRV